MFPAGSATNRWWLGWFLLCQGPGWIAGCQNDDDDDVGSSGLNPNAMLNELSDAEIRQLCVWTTDVEGGPDTHDCGGGVTMTTPSTEECISDLADHSIACRVKDVESCVKSIARDPCAALDGSACSPYLQCFMAQEPME